MSVSPSILLRPLFATLLLAGTAAAQCQFSGLATQPAGPSCNIGPTGCCAIPSAPTQLLVQLDPAACAVDFTVLALEGCCGVTVPLRLVAIGTVPANVPLPQFGIGCTLWLQPDVILVQSGAPLSIVIPPLLPPLTFLAQAAAVIQDPFGQPRVVVTLSDAKAITLQ